MHNQNLEFYMQYSMENTKILYVSSLDNSHKLISKAYEEFYPSILSYITYKTSSQLDSEDLTQDVFLRLLDYKQMLREETIKSFIYTIARNIVIDYIRRHYKKQEVSANMFEFMPTFINDLEHKLEEKELQTMEILKLNTFSPQRKTVYSMSRFDDMSVNDISETLQISKRTVENHLFTSRKMMRDYIRKCV